MNRLRKIFKNMKYRHKLTIFLVVTSLVPMTVLAWYSHSRLSTMVRSSELEDMQSIMEQTRESIDSQTAVYASLLNYLTYSPDIEEIIKEKNIDNYTAAFVFAETDGEPHNTITPIARKVGDMFELDLTLRNNITTEENPLGVYHPHAEYHHIKKENIGLIEVMGLAVLPARLKEELELLEEYILEGKDIASNEKIEKHAAWAAEFLPKYKDINKENVHEILQKEVGIVFTHVLEDAGVYKCTPEGREAFMRFIESL